MHSQPGRTLARFTLRDDRALFLFVFALKCELPTEIMEQKVFLGNLYRGCGWETDQILERVKQADEIYFDRVSQIVAPAWSKGRIVLAGDAAFCVSLLAGQGSALAIVAAYVLAGEIARSQRNIEEGLTRYEQVLRPFIETKQAGAVRFAGAFAPRTRFGVWFRNLVVRSLAIPGVSRLAVGREIIDRLSLPDYPLASR